MEYKWSTNGVQMEYKFSRFQSRIGKLRKPTSAQHIEQTISEFVSELRSRFREQSERDPAGFKKQVVKLVRRHLPPRPGRPNDPRIDSAVQMVQQGSTVKEVLYSQIPGFKNLDSYGRYLAEKGLRTAIARRRTASSNLQRNVR
jgi:hypothetical protein